MADPSSNVPGTDSAAHRPSHRPVFHALPTIVSARLASGRARVASLRRMAAGSVLPLDTPVGEPSRLVVDGVVVAAGEIVEIQGHLALRLTRLGNDRD